MSLTCLVEASQLFILFFLFFGLSFQNQSLSPVLLIVHIVHASLEQ